VYSWWHSSAGDFALTNTGNLYEPHIYRVSNINKFGYYTIDDVNETQRYELKPILYKNGQSIKEFSSSYLISGFGIQRATVENKTKTFYLVTFFGLQNYQLTLQVYDDLWNLVFSQDLNDPVNYITIYMGWPCRFDFTGENFAVLAIKKSLAQGGDVLHSYPVELIVGSISIDSSGSVTIESQRTEQSALETGNVVYKDYQGYSFGVPTYFTKLERSEYFDAGSYSIPIALDYVNNELKFAILNVNSNKIDNGSVSAFGRTLSSYRRNKKDIDFVLDDLTIKIVDEDDVASLQNRLITYLHFVDIKSNSVLIERMENSNYSSNESQNTEKNEDETEITKTNTASSSIIQTHEIVLYVDKTIKFSSLIEEVSTGSYNMYKYWHSDNVSATVIVNEGTWIESSVNTTSSTAFVNDQEIASGNSYNNYSIDESGTLTRSEVGSYPSIQYFATWDFSYVQTTESYDLQRGNRSRIINEPNSGEDVEYGPSFGSYTIPGMSSEARNLFSGAFIADPIFSGEDDFDWVLTLDGSYESSTAQDFNDCLSLYSSLYFPYPCDVEFNYLRPSIQFMVDPRDFDTDKINYLFTINYRSLSMNDTVRFDVTMTDSSEGRVQSIDFKPITNPPKDFSEFKSDTLTLNPIGLY